MTTKTDSAPATCPEPTKSLNCLRADLVGATTLQAELTKIAAAFDPLAQQVAEAPVKLKPAQTGAEEAVQKAQAAKTRLDAALNCKLTDDERKKLETCATEVVPEPEDCECCKLSVDPLRLCACWCEDKTESGTATTPSAADAPVAGSPTDLATLQACAKRTLDDATALVELPEKLKATAEALAASLGELYASLDADKKNAERVWLELRLQHDPTLTQVLRWANPKQFTEPTYADALQKALLAALCVAHRLACALAGAAQSKALADSEQKCREEQKTKDPVDRAMECYGKACADPPDQGKQPEAPADPCPPHGGSTEGGSASSSSGTA